MTFPKTAAVLPIRRLAFRGSARMLSGMVFLVASTGFVASTGCRQTTGPTAGGPLQPFTSPSGSNAAPNLIPFGSGSGSRVAPPATGAITRPNNFMGAASGMTTSPNSFASQSGLSRSAVGNTSGAGFTEQAFPGQSNFASGTAIGSGVQQSNWQTGSAPSQSVQPTSFHADNNTTVPNPARAGGMRVIDLTNAPPPPGYIPRMNTPYASAPYSNQTYPTPSIAASHGSYVDSTRSPTMRSVDQLPALSPTPNSGLQASVNVATQGANRSSDTNTNSWQRDSSPPRIAFPSTSPTPSAQTTNQFGDSQPQGSPGTSTQSGDGLNWSRGPANF